MQRGEIGRIAPWCRKYQTILDIVVRQGREEVERGSRCPRNIGESHPTESLPLVRAGWQNIRRNGRDETERYRIVFLEEQLTRRNLQDLDRVRVSRHSGATKRGDSGVLS